MSNYLKNLLAVSLLVCTFGPVAAIAEENVVPTPENGPVVFEEPDAGYADALVHQDEMHEEPSTDLHLVSRLHAGYRLLDTGGVPSLALPYDYLHSSAVGGLYLNRLSRDLKVSVDGSLINEKDYHGDLSVDYKGSYRLHLRTESLFHHTVHEPPTPSFSFFNDQGQPAAYTIQDLDPSARYGLMAEQDLAHFRYKPEKYPLHLNLAYWRMLREGNRQLRFGDHSFEATANNFSFTTRPVDRKTDEGSAEVDAHIGPVDVVYSFQIRQFHERASIPRTAFVTRSVTEHSEDPDSRFLTHTIKMHTSLDGGLTAGASFSYGRRDNRSRLTEVTGAGQTSTSLQNIAGDVSYIPFKELTLGLKYRRQEIDSNSPATVTAAGTPTAVRPLFDTVRDVLSATVSLRPVDLLTLKGEYRAEFLHRDRQDYPSELLNWHNLPDDSTTHRGTIALLSRPVSGLRLKAQYAYANTDNPSYGTSAAKRHEGQLLLTYARANSWGATGTYRNVREENEEISRSLIELAPQGAADPGAYPKYHLLTQPLGREASRENIVVGAWATPAAPVTVAANFGLLRSRVEQGIMFTVLLNPPPVIGSSTYTGRALFYGVNGTYRFGEATSLSLSLQQTRSHAGFEPQPLSTGTADTGGISAISRVETVENSAAARIDHRLNQTWSCALDYEYHDYDGRGALQLDGRVQLLLASLTAGW